MIPKKLNREQLIGRKAKCDRVIMNRAGQIVGDSAVVKIVNVVRGKGIAIKTEKCPYCGQSAYITGVDRNILTLVPDTSEEQQTNKMKQYEQLKKHEMQYLDKMDDPLEPLKISSALDSEIMKLKYRKEHNPKSISVLDYTIISALAEALERRTGEDETDRCR